MQHIQRARSTDLCHPEIKLKVLVEAPADQQLLAIGLEPRLCYAMVLAAAEVDQLEPSLLPEDVQPPGLAKLFLPHFPAALVGCSMQELLLLEDLEDAVDSQLQAVVVAAAEDLAALSLEERVGWPCPDIANWSLLEHQLSRLKYLKLLALTCDPQA